MKVDSITELIGDTPLLKIDEEVTGLENIDVYVKLEYQSPFGSIKDRVAWELIREDIDEIKEKNQTLLESSSGNTAKAIQGIAGANGLDFKTITNRIKVDEVKDILITMGTEIEELPGKSECPDPNNPDDPLTHLDRLMARDGDKYFRTGQYTNKKNTRVHREHTGQEILDDLGKVDYLFGGLGTTGSTKGTAQKLKEQNPEIEVTGIVSSQDDFIPGIRTANEMWEVGLYEKELYSDRAVIDSKDALAGMLTLIRNCGVLAGPTTGANYIALKRKLSEIDQELDEQRTAVFFACDRFEHYRSYIKKRKPEIYGGNEREGTETLADEELEKVPEIAVEDAEDWMDEENPVIVDSRSNPAYQMAHIPRSINIPEEKLKEMIETGKPFSLNQKILLVCPGGRKSKKFAALLKRDNFEAYSLKEGVTGWRNEGKELKMN